MIIVTGDIHGDVSRIRDFSEWSGLQKEDVIIILGDVGVNYYPTHVRINTNRVKCSF